MGVEIIEVARFGEVLLRTPRFADGIFIFADGKYGDSRGGVAAQHYAARFAAKEAALKALQTGWRGGITWQDVEVLAKDSGAPYLVFRGQALQEFEKFGATVTHLSMSHTTEHAIAQVVLER